MCSCLARRHPLLCYSTVTTSYDRTFGVLLSFDDIWGLQCLDLMRGVYFFFLGDVDLRQRSAAVCWFSSGMA